MSIKDIDPYYYSEQTDEDGNVDIPHGHWLRAADWERKQQDHRKAAQAVASKRACWLSDNPNRLRDLPF